MKVGLTSVQIAVAVNAAILAGLLYTWSRSYHRYRAKITRGLLVFGVGLLAQNALAFYFVWFEPGVQLIFNSFSSVTQHGLLAMAVLELLALGSLTRSTGIRI